MRNVILYVANVFDIITGYGCRVAQLVKCLVTSGYPQWCIAKNGGGYTQRGVAKGLKVPCLFMITEVSIRSQKNSGGWYTPYTRVYPPIHHWLSRWLKFRRSRFKSR